MGLGAAVPNLMNFIGLGALAVTKPWAGAVDVTKPYKFVGFAPLDVTKQYKFARFGSCMYAWAFLGKELQTCYSILRNIASGPEIGLPGRILAGLLPGRHQNRPSGRPMAGRRADFGSFPVAVRPKSGPEGRFPARQHYCVT